MPGLRDAKANKTDSAFREHTEQRGIDPRQCHRGYDQCYNTEMNRVPRGHQTRESAEAMSKLCCGG